MYYVVVDDTAYCLDHAEDILYCVPVDQNLSLDLDKAYEITEVELTEDEHEFVAHIAYHLQQIVKLSEEHQEVFVK